MYSLEGKAAFITGASQGLGKAYAEALLQKQCKVAFCDVNEDTGLDTEKSLVEKFGKANIVFYKADVTQSAEFESAFNKSVATFGRIDIVINNAGVVNEGDWRRMIDINFTAVVHGTQMALKHMRKDLGGAGGRIVNVSSGMALSYTYGAPVYCASKHAVRSYTTSLALEPDLNTKKGVQVASFCPSTSDTDLLRKMDKTKMHYFEKRFPVILGTVMPLSQPTEALIRLIELDDMNGAVLYIHKEGWSFEAMTRQNVGTTWPLPSTESS